VDNILNTLQALESIAFAPGNDGSRGVEQGFQASLDYFVRELSAFIDCEVTLQNFELPFFSENVPPTVQLVSSSLNYTLQRRTDFRTMNFGGNQTVDIEPSALFVVKNFGCQAEEDFVGAKGKVVLVWYNSDESEDCTAYVKSLNAYHSGAISILIANDATRHSLSASRLRGSCSRRNG